MRIDELNYQDVESYLKKDDRLLLVVGACEQHGYLSLMTDIKIPLALADAASQKTGVLVAPPLNFGISPAFLDYPGTISLRASTFMDVVEDLIRSVYRAGFRRLVFVNGHGGNTAGVTRTVELMNELPDLKAAWYSWWIAANVTECAAKHGLHSEHAAWIENFRFTRVAELPAGEKPLVWSKWLHGAAGTRDLAGDGVYGGPYQVDDAIMDELFQVAAQDVIDLVEER